MNLSRSIHAVVFPSDGYYVANCLEVAVVTQGSLWTRRFPTCVKRSACTWRMKTSPN